MAHIILALILQITIQFSLSNSAPVQHCTCEERRGQFGSCALKTPNKVWGNHYDEDIGLYGDCLPEVPENTVKCFRWRVARQCGALQNEVRCSLRQREALTDILEPTNEEQSVTFTSPGFQRQNPTGAYYNRNFCIFNISLSCQADMVELYPLERTTPLSDADTCQDYLSFHTQANPKPLYKLCGKRITDSTKYQTIPSSNFYAVLWTNDNQKESGRFEINAYCKDTDVTSTSSEHHTESSNTVSPSISTTSNFDI